MRGRKPKSAQEHKEAGTFRKGRHAPAAPARPLKVLPKAPAWLSKPAQKKWTETGRQLVEAGILTRLDLDALANYAETWSTWRQALQELKGGLTYEGENGPRKHPAAAVAE